MDYEALATTIAMEFDWHPGLLDYWSIFSFYEADGSIFLRNLLKVIFCTMLCAGETDAAVNHNIKPFVKLLKNHLSHEKTFTYTRLVMK